MREEQEPVRFLRYICNVCLPFRALRVEAPRKQTGEDVHDDTAVGGRALVSEHIPNRDGLTLAEYNRDSGDKWVRFVTYSFRRLSWADAEEVYSNALMEAYVFGWDKILLPDAWMRKKLRHRALDRLRQVDVDLAALAPLPEGEEVNARVWAERSAAGDPEGHALMRAGVAQILQAVDRLQEHFREAILLDVAGFSAEERAVVQGLPSRAAARVQLHRAKTKLQTMLNQQVETASRATTKESTV